jgi:hypothetical protein
MVVTSQNRDALEVKAPKAYATATGGAHRLDFHCALVVMVVPVQVLFLSQRFLMQDMIVTQIEK